MYFFCISTIEVYSPRYMWQQSFVGFCYGEGTFQYFALTVHISVYMYIHVYVQCLATVIVCRQAYRCEFLIEVNLVWYTVTLTYIISISFD